MKIQPHHDIPDNCEEEFDSVCNRQAPFLKPVSCEDVSHNWHKLYEIWELICDGCISQDIRLSDAQIQGDELILTTTNNEGEVIDQFVIDLSGFGGGGGNQTISSTDNGDGTITINLTGTTPSQTLLDICSVVASNCNASFVDNGNQTYTFTDNAGNTDTFTFLSSVATDSTINGDGTQGDPLGVNFDPHPNNIAGVGPSGGVFVPNQIHAGDGVPAAPPMNPDTDQFFWDTDTDELWYWNSVTMMWEGPNGDSMSDLVDNGNGTYTHFPGDGSSQIIDTRAITNPFNPSGSNLSSTNVEDAIKELDDLVNTIDCEDLGDGTFSITRPDGTQCITDEDIRIEVLLDGVLQETLTGSMSDNFSALVSTETDPNESILDWVLVDSVMSDGATVELDMSQYVGFRGAINPPDVTFNVFVGGSGVNFPIESTNVDNTDTECASIILNAVNVVGTPGTEDGTVTYTNATRIAEYGVGPYQMYRQYTITYSNGLTAVFDTVGTTSNQQMWASQRLDNGFWDFLKTRSGTQATTSNNSNANSKWDAYNEGSTVTYTFSQPIEKLTMLVFDLDQSAQGQIDNISPEADAYWQTAGGIDPPDVNANGVYRWRPTGEDNNMYLYWDSPVTTLTATLNETSNILWNATAIYCEIPPEATIV